MAKAVDQDLKDLAWNYFNFHASQRLTTFNFYIAISALLTAGLFTLYQDNHLHAVANLGVGALLFVLSVVFWMLDMRNQELIDIAETALIEYESHCGLSSGPNGRPDKRALFTSEKYLTDMNERPKLLKIPIWRYRYGNCFEIIFFCFGTAGLFGIYWAMWILGL